MSDMCENDGALELAFTIIQLLFEKFTIIIH